MTTNSWVSWFGFPIALVTTIGLMFLLSRALPPNSVSTEPTVGEVRLRAIEKRLLDLESSTSDISFRMRLERRVNNEDSQRRIDEIVARANAARDRDAGRDR